jgi:4-carboxymuconolactone decarboxylase
MTDTPDRLRLAAIPEAQQSAAQRAVSAAIAAGPRGRVGGPFTALLRSPELCQRVQLLGEYLRFNSVVPQRLRELAILATARHWRQNFEWQTHAAIARQLGVPAEKLQALAAGQDPLFDSEERVVLQFCSELHESHDVGDGAYQAALVLLGEQGLVELCSLCGYYGLLAMVLNVARTPSPDASAGPFAPARS